MRVTLKELMERLGVAHVLSPYETQPWVLYDEGKGLTCSAEVRMGPGGADVEAEIQFLKDATDDDGEGESSAAAGGGPEQIMVMKALPGLGGQWAPVDLKVKGEVYVNKMHDWEGKGCNFFRAVIQALQMGQIPDIEALIENELDEDGGMGGKRRGRIGRKAPKIKPAQLLGMKKI